MDSASGIPDVHIVCLIATCDRAHLLRDQALPSVVEQSSPPDRIVIVDDSADPGCLENLNERIPSWPVSIDILRNRRTRGAAGAWNSGLDHIVRTHSDPTCIYVAILDDDDTWDSGYISQAKLLLQEGAEVVATPFRRIENGVVTKLCQPPERLNAFDFLVGNPGIQGSNLIVRLDRLLEAGGFDEALQACTDRDLCIRLARLCPDAYQRTKDVAVNHFACSDRPRLSGRNSPARQAGLDAFLAKHGPHMTSEQQVAFVDRAREYFGYEPNISDRGTAISPALIVGVEDTSINASHVVVGLVADPERASGMRCLFEDLLQVQAEPGIIGMDIVVLENGVAPSPDPTLTALVESFRERGLPLYLIDRNYTRAARAAGELPSDGNPVDRRLGIAAARTELQTYLYHLAKRRPGAVVWILDDDMRLAPLIEDDQGVRRQRIPLGPQLQKMRMRGLDIAIGRYTGAAPLPAVSTVRVQLLDLVWNLRRLASLPPGSTLPSGEDRNRQLRDGRRDYYYDLSRIETDRLETPFHLEPSVPSETVQQALTRLLDCAPRILAGEQVFRPLVLHAAAFNRFETDDTLYRGGNTFVFDLAALADAPNVAPEIDGRPTRRSDMIWALLQRKHCRRYVRSVPVAVYQDRSGLDVPAQLDVEGISDDICGYAVFSALRDQLEDGHEAIDKRAEKYAEERLSALRLSFLRIRGLAIELQAWALAEAPSYASPEKWLVFSRYLQDLYAIKVLKQIELQVGRLDGEQVRSFHDQLPENLDQHQVRLTKSKCIEEQLDAQRIANARVIAAASAKYGARLTILGQGSEAVVFTDGHYVFKVFDYWKARDAARARGLLPSLVGRWERTRGLYPLLAWERPLSGHVLVYPYEGSQPYQGGNGPGLVELLVECHRHEVVCRNIHPKNLRVVGDAVRLIDYGSDIYRLEGTEAGEREFTAMCRRAFLSWRWAHRDDLDELMRRSISEHEMPELEGFDRFIRAVWEAIGVHQAEDPVLGLALKLSPRRVLDYGSGKGKLAARLAEHSECVVAFDPDPRVWPRLEVLADRGVVTARSPTEALDAGPFDVVICRRVACLVNDDQLTNILQDLRQAVAGDGRVLFAFCHPVYAPRCMTPEASPLAIDDNDPECTFIWRKIVRSTGRILEEVHRPEHRLRRLVQRAGFKIVGRHERKTVDLRRFEPIADILVLELVPIARPTVTLLIKACAMEADTLEVQVRHLVSSLEEPRGFAEIVLALDSRRDGFLRQHGKAGLDLVRQNAQILQSQGWLDRIVEAPEKGPCAAQLNEHWLGISAEATHTIMGAPLASILTAFEACKTPLVLHADVDVMVGRVDTDHDYLADMFGVLSQNPDALTVAFNIAQPDHVPYTSGSDEGPWRSESRIGLLHIERLRSRLPLPNVIEGDHPQLAWHRALDRAIASGAGSSWRGGSRATFFVHPPNDRKHDQNTWFSTLDEVERGRLPVKQLGQVEWVGDGRDWVPSDRFEPFIFVITGRNVAPERFSRCIESVLCQRRRDWGAIVIDDASRSTWAAEFASICRPYRDQLTLVRRRLRSGLLANMVEAVRNRCGNPESVIVLLDADDCLIGENVLDELYDHYSSGADATVGSMLRTDKHRRYRVQLRDPRGHRGGNVWQHLRTFRKSLFDAIPDEELRIDGDYVDLANDWAYMLPIIEMAHDPRHIETILYLHEPSGDRSDARREERENIIARLIARGSLARRNRSTG